MRPRNFIIAFVAGAAIAVGLLFTLDLVGKKVVPVQATVLPAGNELPDFSLLNQDGDAIDRRIFEGQWDLVFFGFTHCPDVCPTTMAMLKQVRERLASQGQEPLPRIVLVSVDPERDTPEAIGKYVDYFGEGNLGITGDLTEIRKLTGDLGIYFAKIETDNDNYSVDHSSVVLVINPQGRFRALFSAPLSVDNFVHDLPLIIAMP